MMPEDRRTPFTESRPTPHVLLGPVPKSFPDFPDHELRALQESREIVAFNEEGNLDLTVRDSGDWKE